MAIYTTGDVAPPSVGGPIADAPKPADNTGVSPLLSGIVDMGTSLFKGVMTDRKSSSTSTKQQQDANDLAFLQGFTSDLQSVAGAVPSGSSVSVARSRRELRNLAANAVAQRPDLITDIDKIVEATAGIKMSEETSVDQEQFQAVQGWFQDNPDFFVEAIVRNDDGTTNEALTRQNMERIQSREANRTLELQRMRQESEREDLSDSARERKVSRNVNTVIDTYVAGAYTSQLEGMISLWDPSAPSEDVVNDIANAANAIESKLKAEIAAIGGNPNDPKVLGRIEGLTSPLRLIRQNLESNVGNAELFRKGLEEASKLGLTQTALDVLGPNGPALLPTFLEAAAQGNMADFLERSERLTTAIFSGAASDVQSSMTGTGETRANPVLSEGVTREQAADVARIGATTLNGKTELTPEQVATHMNAVDAALGNPSIKYNIRSSVGQQLYNPNVASRVAAAAASGTVEGERAQRQYMEVGADIVAVSKAKLDNSVVSAVGGSISYESGRFKASVAGIPLEGARFSAAVDTLSDGEFVLTVQGRGGERREVTLPLTSQLNTPDAVVKSLEEAQDELKTLNSVGGSILRLDAATAKEWNEGLDARYGPEAQEVTVDQTIATDSGQINPASNTAQLLDKYEGGGDYDTLFGFSNNGGAFDGVKVSQMTLGELKEFSNVNGKYGQWVKNKIGRVATPMGRFQFVGTTMKQVQKEMGLPDDTVFDEKTQNDMFLYLAQKVMKGKSAAGKRAALRSTWEGLKYATDSELDAMASEIESGRVSFGAGQTSTQRAAGGLEDAAAASLLPNAGNLSGSAVQAIAPQQPTGGGTAEAPAEGPDAVSGGDSATGIDDRAIPYEQRQQVSPSAAPEQPSNDEIPMGMKRVGEKIAETMDKKVQLQLRQFGVDPQDAFLFQSMAEAEEALREGLIGKGEAVVVNGQVYVMDEDGKNPKDTKLSF